MIQCAVAFLLIAGKSSSRLDRLAVTTDEVDKPSYGLYEVKARNRFPHSEFIDKFVFTKTQITGKGTFYMPYCSNHLTSAEIANIITNGLTDITHQAHIGLTHDPNMGKKCLKSLSIMSSLGLEKPIIDISKCRKKVRSMCTSQIILGLAFTGIIAVDGPYKAFSPRIADQPIVVTYDQPLDISSLFLNGEIFVRSNTGHEEYALAWYQGHLHLFKQNLETSEWYPVTLIGSEVKNGPLITNYVLKAFPDSKLQWTILYDFKEDVIQPQKYWFNKISTRFDSHSRKFYSFLTSSERHRDKLVNNYPFLGLKYRNQVHGRHRYSRHDQEVELQTLRNILAWSQKICHQKLIPFRATGTTGSLEEKGIT